MTTEPIPLGTNDANPGHPKPVKPYRLTPNLGESELFPGSTVVQPDTVSHNNGSRSGRNERRAK
jgi:hypothetical protein